MTYRLKYNKYLSGYLLVKYNKYPYLNLFYRL